MAPSPLQQEIRQAKPLALEVEVHLNLTRTQGLLQRAFDSAFRGHGLTDATYNILRILRGAGPDGLPCGEISKRMLTRVPDVTRLIDRLVKLDYVARYRTEADRRLVYQTLTKNGADVLTALDVPLAELNRDQLKHMTKEELRTLNDLLVKARERVTP